MDFINRVKLPMLYKAIVECWEDLDREEKSRIIMNYIDDIKLTKNIKELLDEGKEVGVTVTKNNREEKITDVFERK